MSGKIRTPQEILKLNIESKGKIGESNLIKVFNNLNKKEITNTRNRGDKQ